MKVWIAGHAGMVGSALVRNSPEHHGVVTSGSRRIDFREKRAVAEFIDLERPDAIILAAARVGGIEANSTNQRKFLLENLEIQNTVIETAANFHVPNLIFLGSSCIYPSVTDQPIQESQLMTGPLEPTNEGYAIAKIAGIRLVRAIYDEVGFNYFSLMPTNLYGPGDNFDLINGHVPAALMRKFHEARVSNRSEVSVWGTGKPFREFMHVDDLAYACWMLLEKKCGGELLNVGTGTDISINDFATLMAEITGFQGSIRFDSEKPDGTSRKLLDITKIRSLGWSPTIELEDGIRDTYTWFMSALENGAVRGY